MIITKSSLVSLKSKFANYFEPIDFLQQLSFILNLSRIPFLGFFHKGVLQESNYPVFQTSWSKYLRWLQNQPILKNSNIKTSYKLNGLLSNHDFKKTYIIGFPFLFSEVEKYWVCFFFKTYPSFRSLQNLYQCCQSFFDYWKQKNYQKYSLITQKYYSQQENLGFLIHQLKKPLIDISQSLEHKLLSQPNILENLQLKSQNLLKLIHAYLDIISPSDIINEKISLQNLLKQISIYFNESCKQKHITFTLETNVKNDNVYGKNSLVFQVFENLIENSLKFVSPNGWIKISLLEEQDYLLVYLKDSGKGVDRQDVNKLFQPFFSKSDGHGLGLFYCQKVMKLLQGNIHYIFDLDKENRSFILSFKK